MTHAQVKTAIHKDFNVAPEKVQTEENASENDRARGDRERPDRRVRGQRASPIFSASPVRN
jgi:hypothetical protein